MEALLSQLDTTFLADKALSIASAFVILVVGYLIAGAVSRTIRRRATASPRIDDTFGLFTAALARYAILAIVFVAVLNEFGVATTSVVALLGAAGLAIGLAFQGALSNFASGAMLLFFRPFRIGDYIEAGGHAGTVREIRPFATAIDTLDNAAVTLPNSVIWGSAIVNYTQNETRTIIHTIGVSYDTDLRRAEASIRAAVAAFEGVDGGLLSSDVDPAYVAVVNLGASSVDFTVRAACRTADYFTLNHALLRRIKEQLDADGIEIPFQTQTLHVRTDGGQTPPAAKAAAAPASAS